MSLRSTVAQTTGIASAFAGPMLGVAEATGTLDAVGHKLAVYGASAALTLIGTLVTALFYFVKKEYAAITGGVARLEVAMAEVTRGITELRGEVARRVSVEDHSRSSAHVHEKVNKIAQDVARMQGKLGMASTVEDESL